MSVTEEAATTPNILLEAKDIVQVFGSGAGNQDRLLRAFGIVAATPALYRISQLYGALTSTILLPSTTTPVNTASSTSRFAFLVKCRHG